MYGVGYWILNSCYFLQFNYLFRAANVLIGPLGLKKGERLLVILPRVPQWWLINTACARTGKLPLIS